MNCYQLKSELLVHDRFEPKRGHHGPIAQAVHRRTGQGSYSRVTSKARSTRAEVEEILQINKTRFFALLKEYRQDPASFSIAYNAQPLPGYPRKWKRRLQRAAARERVGGKSRTTHFQLQLLGDAGSPEEKRYHVSATTITKRAKELGCYQPHRKQKVHDREVVTTAIGALVQHDASTHLWSPFATEKWTLITSLDDYSRKLLYADFVTQETSWAHIQAAQAVLKGLWTAFELLCGQSARLPLCPEPRQRLAQACSRDR